MVNFKSEILKAACGQKIEKIIVGGNDGWDHKFKQIPPEITNKLLDWSDIEKHLNFEYDNGFGTEGCPPMTAWTKDFVLFVCCYDGSTWIARISRNPAEIHPEYHGGG